MERAIPITGRQNLTTCGEDSEMGVHSFLRKTCSSIQDGFGDI